MKNSLKALLDSLDKVAEEYEAVADTDASERMHDAVVKGLLDSAPGYQLPDEFGMFEPEGNAKVKAALAKFLAAARVEDPRRPTAGVPVQLVGARCPVTGNCWLWPFNNGHFTLCKRLRKKSKHCTEPRRSLAFSEVKSPQSPPL